MGHEWARRLWVFEQACVRYDDDPLPAEVAFRYRPGGRPVLISAPHGASHWRQGYWKSQDGYTAALAHVLAEHTGAHALYTVRRIRPDPNFEDDSDYKRTLALLLKENDVRLVIDLHGARCDHEFGLALGTIDGRTCPAYEASIIRSFGEQLFTPDCGQPLDRLWINRLFKGGARQRTVTRFVWEQCQVNAAQLEINGHLRTIFPRANPNFAADPARLRRAVTALINIILAV
jgi:hypothetical protein